MSERPKILVLAGTPEARALIHALSERLPHVDCLASLAGAVEDLPEIAAPVRIGGFGGIEGLTALLREERITCVVDASHPFAQVISAHAVAATQKTGPPLLRLERPAWEPRPQDHWIPAMSLDEAARLIPEGSRPLIAVGRKEIGRFTTRHDISALVRMIEPPATELPESWTLILSKPGTGVEEEQELLLHYRISHVVSKNSGGSRSYSKIMAASVLGLPVIMVARPELVPARTCTTVAMLLEELSLLPVLQR